jgi:hypothetical protein
VRKGRQYIPLLVSIDYKGAFVGCFVEPDEVPGIFISIRTTSMKKTAILLLAPFFCLTHLFGQVLKTKPMTEKTVLLVANTQTMRTVEAQKKPAPPAPAATNIQNVVVDIQNGDDGKDNDTEVTINFTDNNKRVAAMYTDVPVTPTGLPARPNDVYYAGSSISLPMKTQTSIPTTQMTKMEGIDVPVFRYATLADFAMAEKSRLLSIQTGMTPGRSKRSM